MMFKYEKDMIPVIQDFFSSKFQKGYFVKEFNAGIGIADLVYSPDINERNFYFDSFEILFHTITLFNRKNKKINDAEIRSKFSKKAIDSLIEKFQELNLIEQCGNNKDYVVKNKLSPTVNEFYSIEAKIKDWKGGFYQALRYQNFSQKSFLAISSDYIHRVDDDILIANNIGLISVTNTESRIMINPRMTRPNNEIAFYYSGENFTKQVFMQQTDEKFCSQQWL